VLFALLTAALALAAPAAEPPRGLVERVVCAEEPDQSYALYVPAVYAEARPAPVLYLLDARGRALLPIERFRAAADALGWVLVSSYNSRSDTSGDPNGPAVTAMWNDTHSRLALDARRAYLGGFSGGGRAAVAMALRLPGRIAGVVGCGAGFPDETSASKALPFAYFGTVGDRDFNYYEMRELDDRLTAAGTPHRLSVFRGDHDWPPAAVSREALAWMELRAIRTGSRAADPAVLRGLYEEDLAGARALEDDGRRTDGYRRYAAMSSDFHGLADTAQADAREKALAGDPSLQKALREERRRDDRDRSSLSTLAAKLRRALDASGTALPPVARVAGELQIPPLRERAEHAGSEEERLSAQRILANLRVQTAFYLPRRFLEAGDWARAVLLLSLAAEIDPDAPSVYYDRAAAHARAGEPGPALADLQRAVDRGFRRFDALEADPDFARLRETAAFRDWLTQAKARV
jgi:predicted esterase